VLDPTNCVPPQVLSSFCLPSLKMYSSPFLEIILSTELESAKCGNSVLDLLVILVGCEK
jgi:hypothetical protein